MYQRMVLSLSVIVVIALSLNTRIPDLPRLDYSYTGTANLDWMYEKWTGDDKPYKQVRERLIRLGNNKAEIEKAREETMRKALANPKDPLLVFTWACAAYASSVSTMNSVTLQDPKLDSVVQYLERAPSPQNYEYTRIHYYLLRILSPSRRLLPVAKRIYEHDPMNLTNKYAYALDCSAAGDRETRAIGVKLAEELVRSDPNNPDYHMALGQTLFRLSGKTLRKADVTRSMAEYRECLRVGAKDNRYRKTAQFMLDRIPIAVQRWEAKHGKLK